MQKPEKRFRKIVAVQLLSKGEGVGFYKGKGLLAKEVDGFNGLEWQHYARDADKDGVKKATFTDEYERIETESVFNHFFNRHAENWTIFKMPLESKSDVHKFDLAVLDIIRFHNRKNEPFEISKRRKHGEQHRTKFVTINGKQVVHEPLDFRFTIKLVPKLEQMSITIDDLKDLIVKEF